MEDGVSDVHDLVFSENDKVDDVKEESQEKEETCSSGGVISNFISALVSRESEEDEDKTEKQNEEKEEEASGGLISHLISNLVPSSHSPRAREDKNIGNGDNEVGGGGGLIESIVSHLPTSLGDVEPVSVPETEEASILIHSIVHD